VKPTGGKSSFVKQAAILGMASIFVRLIGFLYRIPLTNRMGDEGMAFYTTAYFVYGFAIAISSGALPAAVSRLVSERIALRQYRNAHELFNTAFIFAMAIGAGVGLVMWGGANTFAGIFGMPEAAGAIRSLAPTVFFVAILAVFRGYFQGMKTTIPTATSQVIEQIFKVIFTVWFVFLFFDAANLQYAVSRGALGTGIGAVAGVAVVAIMYFTVHGKLRSRADKDRDYANFETRRSQMLKIFFTSLPILISMSIYAATSMLDIGMANWRIGASDAFSGEEITALVGQFNNKFLLLTTLPVALSIALSAAVLPDITTSQVEMDNNAVRSKINMSIRISMILTIPAAVGLAVLADPLIALLFPSHPDGGWLLVYGSVSVVFVALVQVLTGALQGVGKVSIPMIGAAAGVLSKIPVNYFLMYIPEINILGAVISTVICFVIAAAVNIMFLKRYTGIMPDLLGAFGKPLLAAAVMGLAVFVKYQMMAWVASNTVATITALLFGATVYVIFMCAIRGFKHGDIDSLPIPGRVKRWMKI